MLIFYDLVAVFGVLFAAHEVYLVIYSRRQLRRRWYFERLQVMKSRGVSQEDIDKKVKGLIASSRGIAVYMLINNMYWVFLLVSLFSPMSLSSMCVITQSVVFGYVIKQFKKIDEIDTPKMVYLNMVDHMASAIILIVGVVQILQGR